MSINHNTLLDDSRSAYSYKHLIGNMGYWGTWDTGEYLINVDKN